MARILLVEDDVHVRDAVELILDLDGHDVTPVESVARALFNFLSQRFDLVVADIHLPDGSGLEIAERAEQLGLTAILITGASVTVGSDAIHGCLQKPVRAGELLAAVARAVGGSNVIPFPSRRPDHLDRHRTSRR